MKKMWNQAGGTGINSYFALSINNTYKDSPNGNQPDKNSPKNSASKIKSTRKGMIDPRKNSKWDNLKGLDERNLGKILLEKINQSSSQ